MAQTTILLVEDDSDTCEMVAMLLTGAGYQVTCCLDALDALDQVHHLLPDLVITDLWFGTRHDAGWSLIMAMRGSDGTAAIPVILYSADDQFLRTRRAVLRQEHGLILEKPFTVDELLARVDDALAL